MIIPTAHNGLVGGSSPPGPTTHSFELGNFPEIDKWPAIGGLRRLRSSLRGDRFRQKGDFGRAVSVPQFAVPGGSIGMCGSYPQTQT